MAFSGIKRHAIVHYYAQYQSHSIILYSTYTLIDCISQRGICYISGRLRLHIWAIVVTQLDDLCFASAPLSWLGQEYQWDIRLIEMTTNGVMWLEKACWSWWHHQMETFSALLTICAGNSPVNSPQKGQWRGAFMFTLICARINGWVNNR